ncbi:putative tRNA pseudouridine synthase Pus10 isoform X1 [Cephus cinctus]|uniref:tRNA pseudouridine(55) synthase n=2 Tax=Cephus cinctus TaxID=211228 RepID=A0AAJ7BI41_CEPCN|nr:putative tRNA pseudouridine synthase Pus10 isoform X1 [Cephus cinctus]XP_024936644.1 putative tRNA pseudouridine synthase Pus10 isoform X1 [Cephus cinctus]
MTNKRFVKEKVKVRRLGSRRWLDHVISNQDCAHEEYFNIVIQDLKHIQIKMNAIASEKDQEVYNFLNKIGCCPRCCLRFVGIRTPEYYQNVISTLKHLGYINENESVIQELPCVICLGILQDSITDIAVEKVVSEVKKEDHDCPTFTCALTIPIAVQLRERSVQICLGHEFGLSESSLSSLKLRVQSVKDIWKYTAIPLIERATGKHADSVTINASFIIDIFFTYSNDENECKLLLNLCGKTFHLRAVQKRKYSDGVYSRKSVEAAMLTKSDEEFSKHFISPPSLPSRFVVVEKAICNHISIYIGGRYNKFSRDLSQTPWFINGEKKVGTSVQELLCEKIVEFVRADSIKFLSSGREDVDVRTLHSGRPFAIELINPKVTNITTTNLSDLVAKINESTDLVKIDSELKILNKMDLKKLKEGEDSKTKLYRALCICHETPKNPLDSLNNVRNLKIIQKTPVRVLHRRPLTPRTRTIHAMQARWLKAVELENIMSRCKVPNSKDSSLFILDVKTQAGTYVKEFVHGDFGRTKPSICDLLGVDIDIVALDVTSINLEWP